MALKGLCGYSRWFSGNEARQTTVGSALTRCCRCVAAFAVCVLCNESAGSSDVGFGNYGDMK